MDKIAQENEFLTTPIDSEPIIKNWWKTYFAEPHQRIVSNLRGAFQKDMKLRFAFTQAFPGFTWPEFADMATQKSFKDIKEIIDKILSIPGVQANSGVKSAIDNYMAYYNEMVRRLHKRAPQQDIQRKAPQRQPALQNKVKELQGLLGLKPNGVWDQQSNNTFLSWLRENGWVKYIKDNRFTGHIDDAIRALRIERATPDDAKLDLSEFEQRSSERIKALQKLGIK